MNIILYTADCPKCLMLTAKLQQKNIQYMKVNDVELMMQKGFTTVPKLEVDGVVYDFKEAVEWVKEQ